MTAPLSGFTVIDLTRARAGPTATRQLADWGADVIRIEMPGSQDEADVVSSGRDSADFQNLHRNKKSIALDLKSPRGIEVFNRLVQRADVLIENFRPQVKHKLGIDQERCLALNPRLVYASISGFGESGPYRDRPGVDQIVQGLGGLMSINGEPGRGPMRVGIAISDTSAGIFCAFGVLLALLSRERTGRGQWVNTSLLHSLIFMLDFQAARWLVDRQLPTQAGNNHPTAIPMGVFPTRDGMINIAASGQRLWRRFCEAVDAPSLLNDPRFATAAARSQRRDELNALIADLTRKETSAYWVERLNKAGIPAGPIYTIKDTFEDPQVQHLGIVHEVPRTDGKAIHLVEQPVRLAATPSLMRSGAPAHGQHTESVLSALGYSEDEIRALRESKAVE